MAENDVYKEAADAVRAAAGETVERARGKVAEVASAARQRGQQAMEGARVKYDAASERLREGSDKVGQDLGKLRGDVEGYVRENPGTSVLIAAGAGFLVGWLLSRRRP